jgi:hypothetical protein
MSIRLSAAAPAVVFTALLAMPAHAQPAASFEQLADADELSPGQRIEVRDRAGHEVKGRFEQFRAGALVLRVDGAERTFAQSDVAAIRRAGGHAVGLGVLTGASAALVSTYAAANSYGDNEGGRFCTRCFVQWSAVAVPIGAAVGAGIGFAIEARRRRTIYLAADPTRVSVAPVVSPRWNGIIVSLQF